MIHEALRQKPEGFLSENTIIGIVDYGKYNIVYVVKFILQKKKKTGYNEQYVEWEGELG